MNVGGWNNHFLGRISEWDRVVGFYDGWTTPRDAILSDGIVITRSRQRPDSQVKLSLYGALGINLRIEVA